MTEQELKSTMTEIERRAKISKPKKRRKAMTTKTQNASSRSKPQFDAYERLYKGMPVQDATESLRVYVAKGDGETAEIKSPTDCAFSKACKRMYGSTAVLFFGSVAYVDLPDENDVRTVSRFKLNKTCREKIQHFDRTGVFPPGGFLLSKPCPSETFERRRLSNKIRKMSEKQTPVSESHRQATLKGIASRRKVAMEFGGDYRDGTGMVHFVE